MASQVTADMLSNGGNLTLDEANASAILGCRAVTNDGREFRYSLAGATALVQGKLQQSSAEVTNHQNLTPTAAAIGAVSLTVTLGATAATAGQYQDGFAVITVTPGQGYIYRIAYNPAADASASLILTLDDAIVVALTTSSRVDLVRNPYAGLVVNPTTLTSTPVSVAVSAITAAQYGWTQVKGIASVLADGANAVGSNLVASNGVAGAVEDAASPGAQPFVGTAITGAADTEYGAVLLNL